MSDMTKGTNQFASPKKKGFFSTLASQWQLALMSVPIFLYVILFNYVPLWGWSNAFKDYGNRKLVARGITPWNGLENFKWLFSRPDFYQAIRNTLAMSLINLVFGTVAAIVLAVLLNEVRQRAFKRTVQTVTYLPHFLSMVIIVAMAQNIFASNGPVNDLLKLLGMQPVFWLGEGKHFWWLVGIINVWKEVGWGTIIYISAMTAIDPCLYEAAAIDGATVWQRVVHILLPSIRKLAGTLLILQIISVFQIMYEPMVLTKGGPDNASLSLMQLMWQYAFGGSMDYGKASAVAVIVTVILLGMTAVYSYFNNKESDWD